MDDGPQPHLHRAVDAYRTMQPTGKSTTRTVEAKPSSTDEKGKVHPATDEHASRIDAIHLSPTMLHGTQRVVRIEHIPPTTFVVHDPRKVPPHKVSDHSWVRLTYQTSDIPQPKRTPAFASEMLHDAAARATLKQVAKTTLDAARSNGCSPDVREAMLTHAWMQASQQFRKVTQGTIRKRIGAAKTKLKELQSRLCNATTQKDKLAYRAQVERAKQSFYAANAERQRQNMLRRRHVARQEEKDKSEHVHAKIAPKPIADPVNEIATEIEHEDGTKETRVVTDNEGIHRAFLKNWEPIFQMMHDSVAAASAEHGVLSRIRQQVASRLSADETQSVSMAAVLTRSNVREAITRVRAHTAPGRDGVPIEPYLLCAEADDTVVDHLIELYQEILRSGEMPANMKESTTTQATQ